MLPRPEFAIFLEKHIPNAVGVTIGRPRSEALLQYKINIFAIYIKI